MGRTALADSDPGLCWSGMAPQKKGQAAMRHGSRQWLAVILLRMYGATLRIKIENEEVWLRHLEDGGSVLLCAWHQQFYPLVCYFAKFSKFRPSIMISKSKDGEFIARVCRKMGWFPVRGSSSKGGATALKEMTVKLKQNCLKAKP